MITIQELLRLKTDLFDNSRVKLVRHQDGRKEYREILKNREFLINEYQKEQSNPRFHECDYIISFTGMDGTKSMFFGVFKINGVITQKNEKGDIVYDIEEVFGYEDYINRVIIDWGKATQTWHQWYYNEKQVVEILPKGYIGSFPGLTNFVLEFEELEKLIKNPEANRDWENHLSSVNGIYLILDTKSGEQYIGSANGKNGIWQRWSDYANNDHHGGNQMLIELTEVDKNYYKKFRISVLQTLPSNITKPEIDKIEALYKEKMGTKFHGLNRN